MTTAEQLFQNIDRNSYEKICAASGFEALPDDEVSLMAETAYALFYNLNAAGASTADKAILATHI